MRFFTIVLLMFWSSLVFGQPAISLPAGYSWVKVGGDVTYTSGPAYTGNASGNGSVSCCSGGSTTCGSTDTSFGGSNQCSSVPWSVVGTPGANFIQAQKYGNIGTCDNNLAGLAVPCNPGVGSTSAGSNWPSSASETRRVTLNHWNNQYPSSALGPMPTSGTVWLPKAANLAFLDDGIANGTGAGADELRLTMIGGNDNTCSSWTISTSYDLSVAVSGPYGGVSGVNGTKITQNISQSLNNIPNAVNYAYNATNGSLHTCCGGGCSFQGVNNSWYFPGGTNTSSYGTGFAQSYNVYSALVQDGSSFNVDFTSNHSISIDRYNADSGDARATAGPGMGGKVKLDVVYEVWTIQAPAPVEMTAFNAISRSASVDLIWSTASETNNDGFDIERSADGSDWKSIGFVKGRGNSTEEVKYTWTDTEPLPATSYYRLRQVDFDGGSSKTEARKVHFSTLHRTEIHPNPTSGNVAITVNEPCHMKLYDAAGRLVITADATPGSNNLEISHLAAGTYTMRIGSPHDVQVFRLIKN